MDLAAAFELDTALPPTYNHRELDCSVGLIYVTQNGLVTLNMKLSKAIAPLILFLACAVWVAADDTNQSPGRESGGSTIASPTDSLISTLEERPLGAAEMKGAAPEMTQAEKQMMAEENFQRSLIGVKEVIGTLEERVRTMRAATSSPSQDDMDRITRDVSLMDNELQSLNPIGLSPLAQVQWSEQSDRVFNLKVQLNVMAQRWDSGNSVFGISFFTSSPPVANTDQRPVPESYRLRPSDKINVTILSKLGTRDERTVTVDNTGYISIPGAGKTLAAGKTASQLENALAGKVSGKFPQLRVQVTVAQMSSIQVQVSGEVARPGTYLLGGLSTVLNALYQAGGPTKSGTFRRIYLVRDREPKRQIDLYDFLINGSKKQDLPLKDGDLVFVGPVGPTVAVTGEVVRPARFEPTFPTTLGAMLKMAGGAKSSGYLQAVQVDRIIDNEYKVLLNQRMKVADATSSFAIQPGDEIVVSSVKPDKTNQVSISGPVKAPGLYGLREKMRISDLVGLAQGFAADKEVYGGRADILRISPLTGTSIISVNLDKAMKGDQSDNVELAKLDRVFIYEPEQIVFRPKLVTVAGAVANPGTYKRTGGMKVGDAIAAAGGVLPSAHLARADLLRVDSQDRSVLVRVDLQAALNGDPEANLDLRDRDKLRIYSYDEVQWRDSKVRIEGAVQRPGVYVRSEGMRLSDLLFAAGGLLPEAAPVLEVARCAQGPQSKIVSVTLADREPIPDADLTLQDRDVVTVPTVNPSLRAPEVVFLSGEVASPGPYVLNSRDEKLADLIGRAGGLTKYADTNGLLFLRRRGSLEKPQQELDSDLILRKTRLFADKQFLTQLAKSGMTVPTDLLQSTNKSVEELAKPVEMTDKGQTAANAKGQVKGANNGGAVDTTDKATLDLLKNPEGPAKAKTALGEPIKEQGKGTGSDKSGNNGGYIPSGSIDYDPQSRVEELSQPEEVARISVNLDMALSDAKSADNLSLRDGDKILVPKLTNVVTVIGAVLHPHSFAAGGGKSVEYYIQRSGGFSAEAARNDVVVVRTNGDALPMKSVKGVMPGDMIVVPTTGLIDIAQKWEKVGNVTKVVSDILSSVYVLTRF